MSDAKALQSLGVLSLIMRVAERAGFKLCRCLSDVQASMQALEGFKIKRTSQRTVLT